MPSRNITKERVSESFYHVYARGSNKQKIFIDANDYKYFIRLFERYLSEKQIVGKDGTPYPRFHKRITLLAYCLMTNHFHILVYQKNSSDLEKFMRSLMTSYSRYFNLRHKRTGPLFESRYKAVRIDRDSYLHHITRYIHLNPRFWEQYRYSSLRYYREGNEPAWLKTEKVLVLFSSRDDYMRFVADYKELRDMMSELKYQFANN